MQPGKYLTARAAAAALGVSVATVYAYVSRGLIRSEAGADGGTRARRYVHEDVQKLLDQKRFRHDPGEAAAGAMHWGTPVLESALTHITEAGPHYRGQAAVTLATTATIEQVAALLWTGDTTPADDLFAQPPRAIMAAIWPQLPRDIAPLQRMTVALALATAHDMAAYDLDLRFGNVEATGARILALLAAVLADDPALTTPIADALAQHWCPKERAAAGPHRGGIDPLRRPRVERLGLRGAGGGLDRRASLSGGDGGAGGAGGLQTRWPHGPGRGIFS